MAAPESAGAPAPSLLPWIGGAAAALFGPLLFPLFSGKVFTRDDFAALHLPFRYLYREAMQSGASWLWTSAYHSGFYLHGEGIAGMAHPLHLLLYRFLPLGLAFNLEIVIPFAAMLLGTWRLLLQLGLASEAAWFGALVFTFCGFNIFNLAHMNHAAVIAHLPWLLLASHVLLTSPDQKNRALAFAGFALVVGSQQLTGNPQYVWLTSVALAYVVGCLWYTGAPSSRVALLAGAGVLGALLGAVQLLPTLDFARESTRMAYSQQESLSFSLSPLNLVQLWSPFAFRFRIHAPEAESLIVHEFIVYNGAFCTIALAWLAMRWRQQTRRGLLVALFVLAAISFVLAMGRYGGIYTWLSHLPGLRNFRASARHLVLFQLALSGIAAVAFEDLAGMVRRGERAELRRLWPLAIPGVVSLATSALAGGMAESAWAAAHGLAFSNVLRAGVWSAVLVAMTVLIAMAATGVRWALPALIVFVACDQGFWGYSYVYRWGPIQRIDELIAAADVPAAAQPGELIAPAVLGGSGNIAVLRGLRLATGYTGLVASSVLDPDDPTTQRIAGVEWREAGYAWTRTPDHMARARLVATARPSADIRADVRRIDVARVALVDAAVKGLSSEGGGEDTGSARVIEDGPGSIVVETVSGGPRLLVLTERFHRGWRASEDGVARETIRVYGDFLGCRVGPGKHRVALTFAPESALYGLYATVIGLALTVIVTTLDLAKADARAARMKRAVWSLALVLALLWPGRTLHLFDGLPLDGIAEATIFGVAVPLLWLLAPDFLDARLARVAIVFLIVLKVAGSLTLTQQGWCGRFSTTAPFHNRVLTIPIDEPHGILRSWDVRADWRGDAPTCTFIVDRPYATSAAFPAWFTNFTDFLDRPDRVGLRIDESSRHFTLELNGAITVPDTGRFSIGLDQDMVVTGEIDAVHVESLGGVTVEVPLDAGAHKVALRLAMTGNRWRLVPVWNGGSAFRNATLTVGPPRATDRWLAPVLKNATVGVVAVLLLAWLGSVLARYASEPKLLAWTAAASAVLAVMAVSGRGERAAGLLLLGAVAVPVGASARNWRGAMMLIGVPWLSFFVVRALPQIGQVSLYSVDDWLTYQVAGYRIYMNGFWLEGGNPVFDYQPLYRWITGGLHLAFGDSSVGEMYWDAACLLAGGLVAFTLVEAIGGFRWAVGAAAATLATFTVGTIWYFVGRGLSEIAAAGFAFFAALAIMRAGGRLTVAATAGAFAVLMFYARLNQLIFALFLAALWLPRDVDAAWRTLLRAVARINPRPLGVYFVIYVSGVALFALRTWWYSGVFSLLYGTSLKNNDTGLRWWTVGSLAVWQRIGHSVSALVWMNEPPRPDPRALLIVGGMLLSVLALLQVPRLVRLPASIAIVTVGAGVSAFIAHTHAYPGRMSIHLVPFAVAMSIVAIRAARGFRPLAATIVPGASAAPA